MIAKPILLIPSLFALLLATDIVYAERGGMRPVNPGGINRGGEGINRGDEDAVIRRNYNNDQGAVIVAPDSCTTQQVCNDDGDCWSEQNCD